MSEDEASDDEEGKSPSIAESDRLMAHFWESQESQVPFQQLGPDKPASLISEAVISKQGGKDKEELWSNWPEWFLDVCIQGIDALRCRQPEHDTCETYANTLWMPFSHHNQYTLYRNGPLTKTSWILFLRKLH